MLPSTPTCFVELEPKAEKAGPERETPQPPRSGGGNAEKSAGRSEQEAGGRLEKGKGEGGE